MTPFFNDWKRFCFMLREIAAGDDNGRPLSGHEAQKRAQAVLTECGYTWSGYAVKDESPTLTDWPLQPKTRASFTKRSA
jgi:hypothetical protein